MKTEPNNALAMVLTRCLNEAADLTSSSNHGSGDSFTPGFPARLATRFCGVILGEKTASGALGR
jgi:hypothetical protein